MGGITPSAAGVTLLAWGGQLPDTLAAVSLAKNGKPDEAISQAIASQVINISLGLGGPFFAYSLIMGKPTSTEQHYTIEIVAVLVTLSVIAYFIVMLPTRTMLKEWNGAKGRWSVTITNFRAGFLALAFFLLYIGSIAVSQL